MGSTALALDRGALDSEALRKGSFVRMKSWRGAASGERAAAARSLLWTAIIAHLCEQHFIFGFFGTKTFPQFSQLRLRRSAVAPDGRHCLFLHFTEQ
jgi:hypothetical protein